MLLLQSMFHIPKCNRILQTAVRYKNIYSYKRGSNTQNVRKLISPVISPVISSFSMMAVWGVIKNNNEETMNKTQITTKELLTKADTLFDQGDYKGIYDLLSNYKDSKDVEILWRLCRAIYKISEMASDVEAAKLINEGYDLLMALDIQENHYALHKWKFIFLYSKRLLDSTKANIRELQSFAKILFLPKLIKASLQWLLIRGIILIKSSIYCMQKILILPICLLLPFALPISLLLLFVYVCSIIFTTNKHDDCTHTHEKHSLVTFPKTTSNDCSDHLYTAYSNDVPSTHRETSEVDSESQS